MSVTPWRKNVPEELKYSIKGSLAGFGVGDDAGNTIGAYMSGDKANTHACIVIPDMFGWRLPQTQRLCDDLATSTGFLIVCPDLHRGNVVDKWIAEEVFNNPDTWPKGHPVSRVLADMKDVITSLRERGAKHVAVLGISWGAQVALATVNNPLVDPMMKAVVAVSPFEPVEIKEQAVPLLMVACASDEAVSLEVKEKFSLSKNCTIVQGGGHSVLNIPEEYGDGQVARSEVLGIACAFLTKHMPVVAQS